MSSTLSCKNENVNQKERINYYKAVTMNCVIKSRNQIPIVSPAKNKTTNFAQIIFLHGASTKNIFPNIVRQNGIDEILPSAATSLV